MGKCQRLCFICLKVLFCFYFLFCISFVTFVFIKALCQSGKLYINKYLLIESCLGRNGV